ncbi:MAG: hypothetical protein OXO50_00575 [Caldilineaceae bacterium]|nr:hypothetical protein [Caldilineaceae bacterium]
MAPSIMPIYADLCRGAGEDGTLYATGYADGNIYRITPHHGTDGGNASSPN